MLRQMPQQQSRQWTGSLWADHEHCLQAAADLQEAQRRAGRVPEPRLRLPGASVGALRAARGRAAQGVPAAVRPEVPAHPAGHQASFPATVPLPPAAHLVAYSAVTAGCPACQAGSGKSHARLCLPCVPMTTSLDTCGHRSCMLEQGMGSRRTHYARLCTAASARCLRRAA